MDNIKLVELTERRWDMSSEATDIIDMFVIPFSNGEIKALKAYDFNDVNQNRTHYMYDDYTVVKVLRPNGIISYMCGDCVRGSIDLIKTEAGFEGLIEYIKVVLEL